jgi:hypothetical protein
MKGEDLAEIPERALADSRLGAARLLLVAMYRLSPRDAARPLVWPRTATLARMVGADPRTAQRQLRALERAGYIRPVDDGWILVLHADGSAVDGEELPKNERSDKIVASDDNIVGKSTPNHRGMRQDCRREATILSPPTLKEPITRSVQGVEQCETALVSQLELVPDERKRDVVAEIWAYQHELRVWAWAQNGRTGVRAPRRLKLTPTARRAVSSALREYDEAAVRAALDVCSRDAASNSKSLSYFDGVSNWRPRNLARFANNDEATLALRATSNGRSPTTGPLLAQCANDGDGDSAGHRDEIPEELGAMALAEILK